MRRTLFQLAGLAFLCTPALAIHVYVTPDTPSELTGAATTLPWAVVRYDTEAAAYTPALEFPFNTSVDGLHRMDSGAWLLSVDSPAELGGTLFLPQDVIFFDPAGGTYSPFFCGAAVGLGPGTNVDALFLAGGDGGPLVLSFDAPTTIGPAIYDPADLVAFHRTGPGCADWDFGGVVFDASAVSPPVDPSHNVTEADQVGETTIVTFDVPTPGASSTIFLPGELVALPRTDPAQDLPILTSFHRDPAWPPGTVIVGLTGLPAPGAVPSTLRVSLPTPDGSAITLSWEASCSVGAEDYAIYEGRIGEWYSHAAIDCSDDGEPLTETVPASPGNTYYLVVPHNPNGEGSYGADSSGTPRPAGSPAVCVSRQSLNACP